MNTDTQLDVFAERFLKACEQISRMSELLAKDGDWDKIVTHAGTQANLAGFGALLGFTGAQLTAIKSLEKSSTRLEVLTDSIQKLTRRLLLLTALMVVTSIVTIILIVQNS